MQEKVMELLAEICGAEQDELELELDLFEAGLLDSFGVARLLVELDERFNVTFDIAAITREEIATPALIARLVEQAL